MKKLYKSTSDKKLCGVCGGVAEYFGIDPTIVRIVWVLATCLLTWGAGLLVYVIAAFVIPERPENEPPNVVDYQ